MKYLFLILVFLLSLTFSFSQSEEAPPAFTPNEMLALDDKIYKIVDEKPMFPGCENSSTYEEQLECSEINFTRVFYQNYIYPKEAKANKAQGKVYIQFVVNRDGTLSDMDIVRDIGYGCGQAVVDILELLNDSYKWIPAKVNGESVRSLYTLPIKFKL